MNRKWARTNLLRCWINIKSTFYKHSRGEGKKMWKILKTKKRSEQILMGK